MPNAIITGATHGIGKAIAEKFLANGYSIAICARTAADLEACKQQWQTEYPGADITTIATDLTDKSQIMDFADKVTGRFKNVDILVNNAGLFYHGRITEEAEGNLEQMMDVNVYAAYYLTRAMLPAISKQGHIVNISSVAGLEPHLNSGSYSITKYAMMGFSENLRLELQDNGIRVTTICPGYTNSRSWEGSGVDTNKLMKAEDVADMFWTACNLSANSIAETIVMRPANG